MFQNKAEFITAYLEKFQSVHGKGLDEGSIKEKYEALASRIRGRGARSRACWPNTCASAVC